MTTDKQRDKQQAERDALTCVSDANVRQAFEDWVKCQWQLVPEDMPDLQGVENMWNGRWCYTMTRTSELFNAWKAALASPEVQKLVEAASRFVQFYAMLVAMNELDGDEPIKPESIIAMISGCGASDILTAGNFIALSDALTQFTQKKEG